MTNYRSEVRTQAGQILWAEAELLDQCADLIIGTHMTSAEAGACLQQLAIDYRAAASQATRGKDAL